MSNNTPLTLTPTPIKLDDMEKVACENCEGIYFDTVHTIIKIPAVLAHTGKESLVTSERYRCISCHLVTKIVKGPILPGPGR
jgi:hypothetical protein